MARLIGGHSIIYSTNPEADRAFLRDVLGLPNVDTGGGWLIFGLPPAELAVHPAEKNDVHEFYLLCDDVHGFIGDMKQRGIACGPVEEESWGWLTRIPLPGGGRLGIYQPQHARPTTVSARERPEKHPTRARKTSKQKTARPSRKKKTTKR